MDDPKRPFRPVGTTRGPSIKTGGVPRKFFFPSPRGRVTYGFNTYFSSPILRVTHWPSFLCKFIEGEFRFGLTT